MDKSSTEPAYIQTVHVERHVYTVHGDSPAAAESNVGISPGYAVREETSASYTVHGSSSSSQAPASTSIDQGPLVREPDIGYLKSPGAILKIIEAATSLIAFIINITVYYRGSGFTSFATIFGFLHALIWFILYLIRVIPPVIVNYYIDLITSCIILAFLFIGFIIVAVSAPGHSVIIAVCFFCFIAMVAYGVDVAFQGAEIRRRYVERHQ